jgi:molybdate transport repressor ModE-like protein
MDLQLAARWLAANEELDPRVLPLLRAVARTGSLNQAVSSLRLSYRLAWGLLGKTERLLDQPLVILERGRGARLSTLGERLVAADDAAARVLAGKLAPTLRSLNRDVTELRRQSPARPLVIHASHDLALADLRDTLPRSKGVILELLFRGSLECLADLARKQCDIAGFHMPVPASGDDPYAPYRPWLRIRSLKLVRFATRRQGLMVARGNPKRIRALADLASSRVRFVNRQPGSGTRLMLDHLLAAGGISSSRINGYQSEEFTHAAVAATIASGMADAALGIEAAARQQGLDFVPLAAERYYLAARAATLARPAAQALLAAVKAAAYQKRIRALPGYGTDGMGEAVSVREVLRTDQGIKP